MKLVKKLGEMMLVVAMMASMSISALATNATASEYRDGASQISSDVIEVILQNHSTGISAIAEVSEEEISNLFSERSFAVLSGDVDAITEIDRELESYGYYDLSDEEVEMLFPNATSFSYGEPTKPGNTKYVSFKLNPGTTSSGYRYANIVASSNYVPANGQYTAETHPLYNSKELNIYPSKTNYSTAFLKKSVQVGASAAIGALTKTLPGIFLSEFANIAIDEYFTTGQSFGASTYAVTTQNVVFSYLADVPNYYTHYVTAEQCNTLLVYYFAYNDGNGPDTDMAKSRASFTSANYSAPQNKAQSNVNSGYYMRDAYSCGNLSLTYPTMENSTKTVTLSRQYYSELYSIPDI